MQIVNKFFLVVLTASLFIGCKQKSTTPVEVKSKYEKTGSVERLSPELDQIIDTSERPEILAGGFEWSEGPLWLSGQKVLIFSDVPRNIVFQWSEKDSIKVYLQPSGSTDTTIKNGQGSNGLLVDPAGNLILCQHGDRRIARMEASLANPVSEFTTLTDNFNGRKLNSPNDAVLSSNGDIYFTDPPYGLEKGYEDPSRELKFAGVFRYNRDGETMLVSDKMTAPNGIALSEDESKLYVTNSGDGDEQYLMVFDLKGDGSAGVGKVFFKPGGDGHMDGLKVRKDGIIFTTGPGGVLIISPEGKHLGTIITGKPTSNCALDEGENYLYITASDNLMRIKLKK